MVSVFDVIGLPESYDLYGTGGIEVDAARQSVVDVRNVYADLGRFLVILKEVVFKLLCAGSESPIGYEVAAYVDHHFIRPPHFNHCSIGEPVAG